MKKTIYINGRFLTQPNTGVQRYAHEIITGFDQLLEDSEFADEICIRCLVPPGRHQTVSWKNVHLERVGIHHGNLWEQIDLPVFLKGKFVFCPANTGPFWYPNQAVTFHDASIFAVPHAYAFSFRLKYKFIFQSLSRLAKVIFTDSKFSQYELARHLKLPTERFQVIPLAGDHIGRIQPDAKVLDKYNLSKNKYVFMVASQSRHKNLAMVQRATPFIKSDIRVVFAGGSYHSIFSKEMIYATEGRTTMLGYVTDQELKALYLNALGFVFPSHYEGFGLPILEAMHCGCPVLCARAASLPEVAGKAALFFDPADAGNIAWAIDSLCWDRHLRNSLIEMGYEHASEFSWHSTAFNTLSILQATLQNNQ